MRELQIGENRKIDVFQLDMKYQEIQANAAEVAAEIVNSFPELADKDALEQKIAEIVFTYTNLHRWYDYQIGGMEVADVMFARQSLFSAKNDLSEYQHLLNYMEKLKATPWSDKNPGTPYAYSQFIAFAPFEGEDSLKNEGKGFDNEELLAEDGKVYMSSFLEYLIRTFEGTEDYDAWFERQGFVTATSYLPDDIEASSTGKPLWQAMKSLEAKHGNQLSSAYITVLLSVSDRAKIIISNSANGLYFSNVDKQLVTTDETPEEQAQRYADNNNNMFKFILKTGTTEQKELLNTRLQEPTWYTFDAGEVESSFANDSEKLLNGHAEKQKDSNITSVTKNVYDTDNVYLNQFIQAVSPKSGGYLTRADANGVLSSVNGNTVIHLSLNSLNSEYTIAHEETHRMQSVLNGKEKLRGSLEIPAVLSETNEYGLGMVSLNYFYSNSAFSDWNTQIPDSEEDVKNYSKNMLDLIYAWNIEKAKQLFSKSIDEQTGKVYQGFYDTSEPEMMVKRVSKATLEDLAIDPDAADFIEKLVKNKIILPANTSKEQFTYESGSPYSTIPVKTDAIFYLEQTGVDELASEENLLPGWAQSWALEFIGNKGMQGYVDFFTEKYGKSDGEVIQAVFGKSGADYLIDRYTDVANKVKSNQLKNYPEKDLAALVSDHLANDRNAKMDFIKQAIADNNNLFDSIYEAPSANYNAFKAGYWRDYGFVLEGKAGIEGQSFDTKDAVEQTIELLASDGTTVEKKWNGQITNWYGDTNYDGYQVILPTNDLGNLSADSYTFQVRTKDRRTGKEVVSPIKEESGLFSFIGDLSETIAGLEKGTALGNEIDFALSSEGKMQMNVVTKAVTFNKISQYKNAGGAEIIDGWIATDFDFNQQHTKELVIEEANYTKTVPNWNIEETFNISVKDEWKNAGFQAVIPAEHLDKKAFIRVKNEQGNEIAKVALN